jgi:hypothetical protein
LFDENSFEKGSMNAAKIRLKRKTVKKEVQNHYDHDKDFFYILNPVEAQHGHNV